MKKNKNRGYQQLRVWNDAIDYPGSRRPPRFFHGMDECGSVWPGCRPTRASRRVPRAMPVGLHYAETSRVFRGFPYELKRVAGQAIASSDSVHRNIAEGYCRRSIHEYLNFLNIALGSLGESVSGLHAYRKADQIDADVFEQLDRIAYRLENELLKLAESLEQKREQGDWIDHLIVKESNAVYGDD